MIVKLARYFPLAALWMVWFGLRQPGSLFWYLSSMDLFIKFPGNKFIGEGAAFKPTEELYLSPRWHSMGQEMWDFFHAEGWEEKTAWWRWRQS